MLLTLFDFLLTSVFYLSAGKIQGSKSKVGHRYTDSTISLSTVSIPLPCSSVSDLAGLYTKVRQQFENKNNYLHVIHNNFTSKTVN